MSFLLISCFALSTMGALGAAVAFALSAAGKGMERNVRASLAAAALAATPGVTFVVHSVIAAALSPEIAREPYGVWTFLPAAMWVLVGPLVLLKAFFLARPLSLPWLLEALRGLLVLAWLAASFLVVVAGSRV